MAITVKRIALWRKEVDNRPGILAEVLEPLKDAGADLRVVMGYRFPGNESRAALELFPVTGKKQTAAAKAAGLEATSIPTLLVEGDDRPGLGHAFARGLADAGIDLGFLVAQVVGRKYSAVFGFSSEEDLKKATGVLKRVAAAKR
jgi:hypothetical protein